ncbi:hypothetical protein ABIC03_005134 [Bradyrhizobium sp. RT6a]|uniref:hypothetical protein n=2 Tax=Bradyrhizobium TaxID=374 RepID=UPI003399E095
MTDYSGRPVMIFEMHSCLRLHSPDQKANKQRGWVGHRSFGCCMLRAVWLTARSSPPDGEQMFDLYLNDRHKFLVVEKGASLPASAFGKWWKKRRVTSVSEEIKSTVRKQGYYMRKLSDRADAKASRLAQTSE